MSVGPVRLRYILELSAYRLTGTFNPKTVVKRKLAFAARPDEVRSDGERLHYWKGWSAEGKPVGLPFANCEVPTRTNGITI